VANEADEELKQKVREPPPAGWQYQLLHQKDATNLSDRFQVVYVRVTMEDPTGAKSTFDNQSIFPLSEKPSPNEDDPLYLKWQEELTTLS
jgi:hypothetical protein